LGATATNQNDSEEEKEEAESRLSSGNVCFHSVHILHSCRIL